MAAAVGVIVKKRFLLFFVTAMGSLFYAAAKAFGQNSTNGPAVTTSWLVFGNSGKAS